MSDMNILELLERAHSMGSAHPERRGTLYARAADEIRRLRGEPGADPGEGEAEWSARIPCPRCLASVVSSGIGPAGADRLRAMDEAYLAHLSSDCPRGGGA